METNNNQLHIPDIYEENTLLPCVQFINALTQIGHSTHSSLNLLLSSANKVKDPSASVLCAPIQLDQLNAESALDYTDYSRLHDLIQDELKCPEVTPQAPLTAALLCNLGAGSAERRLYELNPEEEAYRPKARILSMTWEPGGRGVRIHLSALTWVALVEALQVLDPDSGVCREELAEEYGEAHVVGACKVQLMRSLKDEMYEGTLNWEGIEIFCVLTPKEVEQWSLEVID